MTTLKEKIAVMQAALDGKPIEHRSLSSTLCLEWCQAYQPPFGKAYQPPFDWMHNEYRVKPEIIKYRRYIYKKEDGTCRVFCYMPTDTTQPETYKEFVRWIDTTWQEEEV
jgi:hypothetical protein